MKIVGTELLKLFSNDYPDASVALDTWLRIAGLAHWRHIMDIRATYSKATDVVEGKTVFNIGGNKYRLITKINYKVQTIRILKVLTHSEYDQGDWKNL